MAVQTGIERQFVVFDLADEVYGVVGRVQLETLAQIEAAWADAHTVAANVRREAGRG